MSRKFIASIMAASMAITGFSAAPARADGNDLARLLAGATALVIIGRALEDDHSSSRHYRYDEHSHYDRGYDRHPSRGNHYGQRRNSNIDSPRRLPPGCLTRVETRHGSRQVFGEACLDVHYSHTASLPRECRSRNNSNGPRNAYEATCLFDRGYRAATR